MKKLFLLPLVPLLLLSCKKTIDVSDPEVITNEISSKSEKLIEFSRVLSKAILEDKNLKAFLKAEALKTKDNDYDVVYGFCKDALVTPDKSFKDLLVEQEEYLGQINSIERKIPTISILVPNLGEDIFNAYSWNTDSEDLFVSTQKNSSEISVLYNGEEITSLKKNEIPSSPILYVKENERIRLKAPLTKSSALNSSSLEFVNDAFNGIVKTKSRGGGRNRGDGVVEFVNGNKFDFEVSPKLVTAFNEFPPVEGGWQRDYVYYNLENVPNAKGQLDRRYYETISAIKITESGLALMMDQNDPNYNQNDDFDSNTPGRTSRGPAKFWTDGNFEIQIDALINDLSGAGAAYSTVLSVPGDQLFGASYDQTISSSSRPGIPTFYRRTLVKLVPKFFYCHIPIKEWDLEKMGGSWKISVRENDDNEIVTIQENVTSKFATNFGVDVTIGLDQYSKIGLKFGGSTEQTHTQQVTVQRTLTNDFLGDAIVNFWDPILRINNPVSKTNPGFLVDLRSLDKRLSAVSYVNKVEYNITATDIPSYKAEQDAIKASSENRYELESFNRIINNNYELIILPTYKY